MRLSGNQYPLSCISESCCTVRSSNTYTANSFRELKTEGLPACKSTGCDRYIARGVIRTLRDSFCEKRVKQSGTMVYDCPCSFLWERAGILYFPDAAYPKHFF